MDKLRDRVAIVTGGAGASAARSPPPSPPRARTLSSPTSGEEAAAPVLDAIAAAAAAACSSRPMSATRRTSGRWWNGPGQSWVRVDILVNNAGTFSQVFFQDLTAAEWDRVLGVNLRGCFLCTRMVIPAMLERGAGVIINIASQLGQIGGTEMVHYSASKAGVIGFTKALAREVSARGVRVNAIAPGPILTEMMAQETEEWASQKLAELPINRFGEVHEVAPDGRVSRLRRCVVLRGADARTQRRRRDALMVTPTKGRDV